MYLGRIVEIGKTQEIMSTPQHPYTKALLSAIPRLGEKRQQRTVLEGELPDPANPPSGCAFHARCPQAMEICNSKRPEMKPMRDRGEESEVACHLFQN
jgi:oligopeptide/dipeptide ABC transporter ATP-binding protein